jgi:hypothetical protein
MALGASVTATTATTATFAFTGLAADGNIELQLATRADFEFCPAAPIYRIARAAAYTAPGLNQRNTYYARARSRRASGALDGGWTPTFGFRTADGTAQVTTPAAVVVTPAMIVIPEPIVDMYSHPGGTAGFPLGNLHRDAPVAFRMPSDAGNNRFLLYFSTVGPVDTIALLNTNLPEAATVRILSAATIAGIDGGNPASDSGTLPFRASSDLPGRDAYHGLWQVPLAARAWRRIEINVPGGLPGDSLYIEHFVVGRNLATKNMASESTETYGDLGSFERTRLGLPDRLRGYKTRRYDFDISQLTETQHETVLRALNAQVNDRILAVPNSKIGPFLHDRILYGRLTALKMAKQSSLRYERSLSIDSII